jgi:hypothetical protein
MSTGVLTKQPDLPTTEARIDWESPAGPDKTVPRSSRARYVFAGPGEPHWMGQPCEVVSANGGSAQTDLVQLACGCRGWVPRSTLRKVH